MRLPTSLLVAMLLMMAAMTSCVTGHAEVVGGKHGAAVLLADPEQMDETADFFDKNCRSETPCAVLNPEAQENLNKTIRQLQEQVKELARRNVELRKLKGI